MKVRSMDTATARLLRREALSHTNLVMWGLPLAQPVAVHHTILQLHPPLSYPHPGTHTTYNCKIAGKQAVLTQSEHIVELHRLNVCLHISYCVAVGITLQPSILDLRGKSCMYISQMPFVNSLVVKVQCCAARYAVDDALLKVKPIH